MALVVMTSGCAQPEHTGPTNQVLSASPKISPPNDPTDRIKPTDAIVGTVTSGGTGPCYGLVTDEGVEYALHSTAGTELVKGSRIRIKGETATVRIYCGPGKLLELISAEPLR